MNDYQKRNIKRAIEIKERHEREAKERRLRLEALSEYSAYEKAHEIEPPGFHQYSKQFFLDIIEKKTIDAIRHGDDDFVKLRIWSATGVVLALKGIIRHPPKGGKPYSYQKRRELMDQRLHKQYWSKLNKQPPKPDPVVVEARALEAKLKADAKRKREKASAETLTEKAAQQTHDKHKPLPYSWQTLARRMKRPGKYAPS